MNVRLALVLLLASLGPARSAGAATLIYFDPFGEVTVPFGATALVTLPQFDPSLGTLTQVTLTLDVSTFDGVISWDNEAPVSTDITLGIGAVVTATGPGGASAEAIPLQTDSATGIDADNDGAADFIGTDAFSVVGGSGADSDSTVLVAGLAPYVGLGTYQVDVSASVETYLSTTGGFGPIDPVPGKVQGTVTVTYEYTVPEPGAAWLLGAGLLGGAVRARRRGGSG